jgi:hypothetical protein
MNDKVLSIAGYDQRETEARVGASYPALRAFSPVAFAHANFPARVTHEFELRRYADIMYETRSRKEWIETKLYSATEADAMVQLSAQIEQLTARLFGKPVQPLMCLFAPIDLMRVVEHLAAIAGRRLTVCEIGPGSGHLAAYLLNAGHRIIAVDNCQSLYLWQNRLFGTYDDLDEWATENVEILPRRSVAANITHIPWWHFVRFHESLPIEADIVICDAALGEMDHFGFRYVANVVKGVVAKSDIGCFLYQNLGEERFQQRTFVEQYLATLGFRLLTVGGVSVQASDRLRADNLKGLRQPPPLGDSKSMQPPARFLPLDRSKLLESYAFFDFIGIGR